VANESMEPAELLHRLEVKDKVADSKPVEFSRGKLKINAVLRIPLESTAIVASTQRNEKATPAFFTSFCL